ncbi:UNVERIFIED_CONTAM: hypothetical protein PYX00_010406 [Menopon gallinae]|uniref:Uncharacterized protein n=1 Tax=Menopon gallinae TaxID=328185 RepID=A0AAW2HF58_9NEOP
MRMSRNFFVVLILCLFGLLLAEDQQREEDQQSQQSTGLSTLPIPSTYHFRLIVFFSVWAVFFTY